MNSEPSMNHPIQNNPASNSAGSQPLTGTISTTDIHHLLDVKVEVTVELGRRHMSLADILKLTPHTVLELLKRSDEPLDVRVNGRLIAKGEAVLMGDRYGVRITEIISNHKTSGQISLGENI